MGKKSKKRASKARGANAPRPLGFTGEEDAKIANDPLLMARMQRTLQEESASMAKLFSPGELSSLSNGKFDPPMMDLMIEIRSEIIVASSGCS